jgi:hypothetical protein
MADEVMQCASIGTDAACTDLLVLVTMSCFAPQTHDHVWQIKF